MIHKYLYLNYDAENADFNAFKRLILVPKIDFIHEMTHQYNTSIACKHFHQRKIFLAFLYSQEHIGFIPEKN